MATVSQSESTEWDQPRFVGAPRTTYVIASQPRCGSHYLASLLRSTGDAGVPLEYFNTGHWKRWAHRCGQYNPGAAFRLLREHRTTPNGVFGVKAHWRQFQMACRLRLESEFRDARFVLITRRDLLGQSISLAIARQTGAWVSAHQPQRPPEFSLRAIEIAMRQVLSERDDWERFFAVTGIEPLRLVYEDLLADRDGSMTAVCGHLGLTWAGGRSSLDVGIQRNELSEEWRRRYREMVPTLHEAGCFWRGEFGGVEDLGPS